jgi:trans-2,3-dihydro-3-hydroxyanthranilate isomerase
MQYVLADVFTDIAFGGNQLAVFPNAEGLDGRQMQAIARELNLAESTFVTPGTAKGRFRMRIFTPLAELPFAGHPTVGTAVVLAYLGMTDDAPEIVLEEGVGPVRVVLRDGGAIFFMDGAAETRPHSLPAEAFAEAIGLKPAQLTGLPWQAGYGVPYTLIGVADRAAVAQSRLLADRWEKLVPGLWGARAVYVHAVTGQEGDTLHLHARMFAPKLGVVEDPATGSAAAALAGSIATEATRLVIAQGVEMGRPSLIEAGIARASGKVTGITIGGGALVVGEGRFTRLP